jgi:3-oxoadipate enol-lactonase
VAQIAVNGIQMHVLRMPAKGKPRADEARPTVVFIHGLGPDSLASFYFTLAAPVSTDGIEVIAYDLRGHGRSCRPAAGYRVTDFVADLSGLLDALEVPGPVHLVGNSYGGTVAFSYALAHPQRVASLVLIEAEPATKPWSRKIAKLFDRLGRLDDPSEMAWVATQYGPYIARLAKVTSHKLHTTTMAYEIPSGPLLSREQIRSVRCPVLAILGSDSEFVGNAEFISLLPDCRTVIVPGHGHWLLMDTPRTIRDLLLDWIAERGRSTWQQAPGLALGSHAEVSPA